MTKRTCRSTKTRRGKSIPLRQLGDDTLLQMIDDLSMEVDASLDVNDENLANDIEGEIEEIRQILDERK
jgi:hypothetical protein